MDLLKTIGVANRVRRTGLYSALKMGPNQRVIRGGGAGANTESSSNDRLIIKSIGISLEAASLHNSPGLEQRLRPAFGGIERGAPIYQPIPDIVVGALQVVTL